MARSKSRMSNEINASSMADIAFLLLIFFLVTTTIDVDKGILHKLPPWTEEDPPEAESNDRNTLVVLLNSLDQLLVDGEEMQVENLKETTKEFIDNPANRPDLAESPDKAIVSLQNDRGTSYDSYIQVQNELKAAYRELRDEYSMENYGKLYDDLDREKQKMIQKEIYPMKISEAEPKEIGG